MWAQLIRTQVRWDAADDDVAARTAMAGPYEGTPVFTDLTVIAEWAEGE